MNPAQRLLLDVRISEERMTEIDPHGEEPDWTGVFNGGSHPIPCVWTMNAAGVASRRWEWLDSIVWADVVAVRLEYAQGQRIDVRDVQAVLAADE